MASEEMQFLTEAFTALAVPHTVLNHLIVNDPRVGRTTTPSTSTTTSPLLRPLVANSSSPADQSADRLRALQETYMPTKAPRAIQDDLEHILDYSNHSETTTLVESIARASNVNDRSRIYTAYYSKLMSQSNLPAKYAHLVTSANYYQTLHQCVEYYIIQNIFHSIFPIDFDRDMQFTKRIESLAFIEPVHLGIGIEEDQLALAIKYINRMNSYQTPTAKKRCITKAMIQLIAINGEDYLLPMAIYLLIRTNPPNLWSNCRYLETYSTDQDMFFFFTTFTLAIQLIDKLDHSHLSIDRDFYNLHFTDTSSPSVASNGADTQPQEQQQQSEVEKEKSKESEMAGKAGTPPPTDSDDVLENVKLFKQLNRLPTAIEILSSQMNARHVEELMLKLISVALTHQNYHARVRFALRRLFVEHMRAPDTAFCAAEMAVIGVLQDATAKGDSALELLPPRGNKTNPLKVAKIAGAAVTGAVLVGITGGLAAPFVGTVLSAIGAGSLMTGLVATTGLSGATMLSVVFGAAGAKVSADKMMIATSGVQDYSIHKVKTQTSLHAIIYVDGFTETTSDTSSSTPKPPHGTPVVWEHMIRRVTEEYGDIFLIDYERDIKSKLQAIISEYQKTLVQTLFKSAATNIISQSLAHALVPLSILKAASVLDNPWSLLKDRSEKAGKILANQIVQGSFGKRPLTLIGTGMGSRMIFYCLEELARLATKPTPQGTSNPSSIIEMVVFIGAPVGSDPKRWSNILSVIGGRVINCYSPKDVVLNQKPKPQQGGRPGGPERSKFNQRPNKKPGMAPISNAPSLPLSSLPDSFLERNNQQRTNSKESNKLNEEFLNQLFHEMEIDPMQPNHPTHLPLVDPRKVMKEYSLNDAKSDMAKKKKEIQDKIENGELSDQKMLFEESIGPATDGPKVHKTDHTVRPFYNEDIFLNDDQLFFFQFPTSLPSTLTKPTFAIPAIFQTPQAPAQRPVPVKEGDPPKEIPPVILNNESFVPLVYPGDFSNTLKSLPSGLLGNLQIYKSGKVILKIGSVEFDVSAANKLKFLEEVKCITPEGPTCFTLGTPAQHLVAAPILKSCQ
eukprot:gene1112-1270_t